MASVSVMIPTYNSGVYLEECINSVRKQNIEDLEILVIDAYSTDQTNDIVKSAMEEDSRIRLIYSEKKSYGYQLNKGIQEAKGEYIAIVESDDYILPGMLSELCRVAQECDADFVKGDYEYFLAAANKSVFTQKECLPQNLRQVYNKVIRPLDYPEIYVGDIFLWKGIYKLDFLNNKGIRFHESPGAAYQDVGFIYQVFVNAQRAVYVNKYFYRYRKNNSNSSTYNHKGFQYLEREYTYVENIAAAEGGINPILEGYYYKKMFHQTLTRFRVMGASGRFWEDAVEDILKLREKIQKARHEAKLDAGLFGEQLWQECLMLMADIESYATYNIQLMQTKVNAWHDMKKALGQYKEIVLVSTSQLNKFLFALLDENQADCVQAFCDRDVSKWGDIIMGKRVYSYERVSEIYPHAAYVIANNHYNPGMKHQLTQLGIDETDIYIYPFGVDWLMAVT